MVKQVKLIFLLTLGLTVAYRPKPAYHPRSRKIHQRESDYEGSALHKHTAYLPEKCIPECNGTEPIAFITFEPKCPEKLTSGMKEDIGNVQLSKNLLCTLGGVSFYSSFHSSVRLTLHPEVNRKLSEKCVLYYQEAF